VNRLRVATIAYPRLAVAVLLPLSLGCRCLPYLAPYRTRENFKPQAARCGFLLWLVPLALMQKSLRHKGEVFAWGCGKRRARKAASEQPIEI